MVKTKSHIQVVELSAFDRTAQLVIRPPKFLNVFRCTIYFTSPVVGSIGYLSTQNSSSDLDAIQFSSVDIGNISTTAIPSKWPTDTQIGIKQLVLDRRGVGYFADEFHVYGTLDSPAYFYFVWEGEIS
jgi:hypothetical protein